MNQLVEAIEKGQLIVLTEQKLKELLRSQALDVYKAKSRGLMTYEQARDVFQLSTAGFKKLLNDPDCLIRKSKLKGRVLAQSVFDEVERLTNPADF